MSYSLGGFRRNTQHICHLASEASGESKQNECHIATGASGENKQPTSHIATLASGKDKQNGTTFYAPELGLKLMYA